MLDKPVLIYPIEKELCHTGSNFQLDIPINTFASNNSLIYRVYKNSN
jgi:hypothetical protein